MAAANYADSAAASFKATYMGAKCENDSITATIECLLARPVESLLSVKDTLRYHPDYDGVILKRNPLELIQNSSRLNDREPIFYTSLVNEELYAGELLIHGR